MSFMSPVRNTLSRAILQYMSLCNHPICPLSVSFLGRLLKAFQIDFNWYHLASWINITEQWPFRTSWLILHYDMYEESLDDNMSLKSLYDKYVNLIFFILLFYVTFFKFIY